MGVDDIDYCPKCGWQGYVVCEDEENCKCTKCGWTGIFKEIRPEGLVD